MNSNHHSPSLSFSPDFLWHYINTAIIHQLQWWTTPGYTSSWCKHAKKCIRFELQWFVYECVNEQKVCTCACTNNYCTKFWLKMWSRWSSFRCLEWASLCTPIHFHFGEWVVWKKGVHLLQVQCLVSKGTPHLLITTVFTEQSILSWKQMMGMHVHVHALSNHCRAKLLTMN